jgi:hypothetical protein
LAACAHIGEVEHDGPQRESGIPDDKANEVVGRPNTDHIPRGDFQIISHGLCDVGDQPKKLIAREPEAIAGDGFSIGALGDTRQQCSDEIIAHGKQLSWWKIWIAVWAHSFS